MTKALIAAIFLSQAPIQDVRVFHTDPPMEVINYDPNDLLVPSRRVNTIHIRRFDSRTVVVSKDAWNTPKAPVPYYEYWDCPWKQTAQQCVAIYSLIQQELKE
jgi:hypothetical protein